MPRPTVAQLAYGSGTVICSTIAMLLLSRTSAGPGVGVIAVSALILGVFVAMSVPRQKSVRAAQSPDAGPATAGFERRIASTLPSPAGDQVREPVRETAGP
jgi:hypothetical protein